MRKSNGEKSIKNVIKVILAVTVLITIVSSVIVANAATSGDAYVNFDSANKIWTIGTNSVEKILKFDTAGHFNLTNFKNKLTNREYMQGGATSDEFRIKIDGVQYTGSSTTWIYDTYTTSVLSQGELKLSITFHNSILQVTRNYIIYPDTGVIQEWTDYKNISGSSRLFSDPSISRLNTVMSSDKANVDFYYMTGGGNFTGAFMLKDISMAGSSYSRLFDSQDAPEVQKVEEINDPNNDPDGDDMVNFSDGQNTAQYNLFYALRNRNLNDGIFITFDYYGRWRYNADNSTGVSINGYAMVDSKPVASQATLTSPLSMTGVFSGDIDDMGNTILYYQYKYKWDYTKDTYLGMSFTKQWVLGPQKDTFFRQVGYARYIGADGVHVDDNWFDKRGDWNNLSGENFNEFNTYAKKNNLNFMFWMPLWHADEGSTVYNSHPDWIVDWNDWYKYILDIGNSVCRQWQRDLFSSKQSQYGSSIIKYDGYLVYPKDTISGASYDRAINWLSLLKGFKDDNPNAGLYGCSSGGGNLSIEQCRYVDVQGLTDGWALHYTDYWTTLLFPPAKAYATNIGTEAPMNQTQLEKWRKSVLLNNYMRSKGVDVRWSKVYRPTLSSGDQTYLHQSMSGDNNCGYISIHSQSGLKNQTFIIYPKGLNDNTNYTVSSLNGNIPTAITHTGSWWETNGISITNFQDNGSSSWDRCEYIFFNMEDRPDSGTDTIAPTAPANVIQNPATYLGYSGMEVRWTAGSDNRRIAYYEIIKNGVAYSKVAEGTFFFDAGAAANDTYQIRTVDGDGNVSAAVSDQYALVSDFSTAQGQRNWYYKQWNGSTYTDMTWDSTLVRWQGAYNNNFIWEKDRLHPDTNDTAVAWKAPYAGTVDISGYVKKFNTAGGDGVRVKIMKNGTQIWPASGWQSIAYNNGTGYNATAIVDVAANDMIYFVVNKNGDFYYDGTQWDPVIHYINRQYSLFDDYSTNQGQRNWYYKQWNGSSYTDMTWNIPQAKWSGAYTYNMIWEKDRLHPDTNDTAVAWKAPFAGTVNISGYVKKFNTAGGDGVRVKIMKNGTQIWPSSGWQSIAGNDGVGYNAAATVTVAANDMIYFVVNKNGDTYFDGTQWDPVIQYQ